MFTWHYRWVGSRENGLPDWFVPLMRTIFNERVAKFWDKCAETGKVTGERSS